MLVRADAWVKPMLCAMPSGGAQFVGYDLLPLCATVQVYGRGPGREVPHPLHPLSEVRARVQLVESIVPTM
jgi:hypothetical protein